MAVTRQMRLPLNATLVTSKQVTHARRHSAPEVMSQNFVEDESRSSTPEIGQKTMLQRAPTKFEKYEVAAPERLWRAMTPTSRPNTGSSDGKRRQSHSPVPSHCIANGDRCSRCTRLEMWAAYNVFRSMDKRGLHKISRQDYLKTMSNFPTLEKLKVLKRSGLEDRFRENAKEVTLEEFLQLMWPHATKEDLKKMQYWAKLRDAQELVRSGSFTGQVQELREVFDLLDKDLNHLLEDNELKCILEKNEIEQMMREVEAHRAQFKVDESVAEVKKKLNIRLEFKKFLSKGKTRSSSTVEQILQEENAFKNKLTFDEFCHLVQPRQSTAPNKQTKQKL
jgi:Ca2+-binding EF-hand superfamily protein